MNSNKKSAKIAGLLYLVDDISGFTAITYVSYPLGFIAEFGLTLWLLIKGVQDEKLT